MHSQEPAAEEDRLISDRLNRYRYKISLRVWHPSMDPARISATLGLSPSRLWRAGEPRSTPTGRLLKGERAETYWYAQISAGTEADTELGAAISKAIDRLMPNKAFFHQIRAEGGKAEFFIGWFFEGQSGDTFDCDLLGRLSDIKIDLALDIY